MRIPGCSTLTSGLLISCGPTAFDSCLSRLQQSSVSLISGGELSELGLVRPLSRLLSGLVSPASSLIEPAAVTGQSDTQASSDGPSSSQNFTRAFSPANFKGANFLTTKGAQAAPNNAAWRHQSGASRHLYQKHFQPLKCPSCMQSRGLSTSSCPQAALQEGREAPDRPRQPSSIMPADPDALKIFKSQKMKESASATLLAWGEMIDQGDADGVLAMLAKKFQDSNLPSMEKMLNVREDDTLAREQRRQREKDLQEAQAAQRVRVVDALGRAYSTGKRKCSVARVWVWQGQGALKVNGKALDRYFSTVQGRLDVLHPFTATGTLGQFDVRATVKGGGTTGQAQALRHGISKALRAFDPQLHPPLRAQGLLTRDARVVERKKPGKPKARKSFQWVKR